MRLWHENLIRFLPKQQLLGQHRECCALRGRGWGKKHATVNYVFSYSPYKLYQYHLLVMREMIRRGFQPEQKWEDPLYRGQHMDKYKSFECIANTNPIYKEHNNLYLEECLANLRTKGIFLEISNKR